MLTLLRILAAFGFALVWFYVLGRVWFVCRYGEAPERWILGGQKRRT